MSEERTDEKESAKASVPKQEKPTDMKAPLVYLLGAAFLVPLALLSWAVFLFPETIQLAALIELLSSHWSFVVLGMTSWGLLEISLRKASLNRNVASVKLLWLVPTLLVTLSLVILLSSKILADLSTMELFAIVFIVVFTAVLTWRSNFTEPVILVFSGQCFLLCQSILNQRIVHDPLINTFLFISVPLTWLFLSAWSQKGILVCANSFFTAFISLNAITLSAGWPTVELSILGIVSSAAVYWWAKQLGKSKEPLAELTRFYSSSFLLWLTTGLPSCLAWVNGLLSSLELSVLFLLLIGLVFLIETARKNEIRIRVTAVHGILLELSLVLIAVIGTETVDFPFYFLQSGLMGVLAIYLLLERNKMVDLATTFSVCAVVTFLPYNEHFKVIGLVSWLFYAGFLESRDWRSGTIGIDAEKVHWSRLVILIAFFLLVILLGQVTEVQLIVVLATAIFTYGTIKRFVWHLLGRKTADEMLVPLLGAVLLLLSGMLTGITPAWMFSTFIGIFIIAILLLEITLPHPRQWLSTLSLASLQGIFALSLLVRDNNLVEWQVVTITCVMAGIFGGLGMELPAKNTEFQKVERWFLLFGTIGGIFLTVLISQLSFESAILPVLTFSFALLFWIIIRRPDEKEDFAIFTCFPPLIALFILYLAKIHIITHLNEVSFLFTWVLMALLSNAAVILLESIPTVEKARETAKVFDLPAIVEGANAIGLAGFFALGAVTLDAFIVIWSFFVLVYLAWRLFTVKKTRSQLKLPPINVIIGILVVTFFAITSLVRPVSVPLVIITLFMLMQAVYITGIRLTSTVPHVLQSLEAIRPASLAGSLLTWCLAVRVPQGWFLLALLIVIAAEITLNAANNYKGEPASEKTSLLVSIAAAGAVAAGSIGIYSLSSGGAALDPELDSVILEALIPTFLLVLTIIWPVVYFWKTTSEDITTPFSGFAVIGIIALFETGTWLQMEPLLTAMAVLVYSAALFAGKKTVQDETRIRWSQVEGYTFVTVTAILILLDAFNPFNGAAIAVMGGVLVSRGILQKQKDYQMSGGLSLALGTAVVIWEIYARMVGTGAQITLLDVLNLTVIALLVLGITGLYQLSKTLTIKAAPPT
ncbi:MAG: hypothetical protein ACFFD4_05375 [Candidatus Odinarchaeota archaeon]